MGVGQHVEVNASALAEEEKLKDDYESNGEEVGDEVSKVVGDCGRWQLRIFIIVSLTGILTSWHMMVVSFYAPNVNHWCAPPENVTQYQNWTVIRWKNYSIPADEKDKTHLSRCKMYNRDYINGVTDSSQNLSTVDCLYDWEFDTSQFDNTMEKEWSLVCNREALAKTGAAIYYAGVVVGVILFGQVSDKIGRKKCLCITILMSLIFGVMTSFMPYLELVFVTRFFVAMGVIGAFTTGFVLCMELVDGKWRTIIGIGFEIPWCIGYISLTAVGYFINGWRNIQLFISVPIILYLSYWWLVPESPRWLLSQGRRHEAYKILCNAAGENKRPIPDLQEKGQAQKETNEVTEKASLLDLFKYPVLRARTLNLYFNWFVNAFAYYGLSLGTNNLGGNVFVNFFIAGAIELPAYVLCLWVLLKKGRRLPLCISMVIGGIACLATIGFKKGVYAYDWPIVTLAMIGKFCISASFAIVYVFSAELYPTVVRNVGFGSCSFCARIASMIAPYVDLARHLHPAVPLIIYGSLSVLAGMLILLLPDTSNQPLPQTIQDAENFGRKKTSGKPLRLK